MKVTQTAVAARSPFRQLCAIMKEAIEARFPGKWMFGLGGFLFLRFICPAIVAPEAYGFARSTPPLTG